MKTAILGEAVRPWFQPLRLLPALTLPVLTKMNSKPSNLFPISYEIANRSRVLRVFE